MGLIEEQLIVQSCKAKSLLTKVIINIWCIVDANAKLKLRTIDLRKKRSRNICTDYKSCENIVEKKVGQMKKFYF